MNGGLHPDTEVKIIQERKGNSKTVKISEVEPGQFIKSAFDKYYWKVSEVRKQRRKVDSFRFRLESGLELCASEGTLICGQSSVHTLAKRLQSEYCIVDLNFHDRNSRRRFRVSLKNAGSGEPDSVSSEFPKKDRTKKYYNFIDLISFLEKLRSRNSFLQIFWGTIVSHPSNGYRFGNLFGDDFFMPFVPLRKNDSFFGSEPNLALIAIRDGFRIEYQKVEETEIRREVEDWILPIFDEHCDQPADFDEYEKHKPYNRFVFLASKVPVATFNRFMSMDGTRITAPRDGEVLFPPPPTLPQS